MSSDDTEWQDVDMGVVDAQADEVKKAGERRFARKVPMGRSVWRAAPPRKDRPATPFKVVWVHEIRHPQTDEFLFSGECPLKSGKGSACAACAEASRRARTAVTAKDKEAAKKFRARQKPFMNAGQIAPAVGQEDFKPDEGFVPLELAWDCYKTLNDAFHETLAAGGNFTHPDTGRELVFERTPKTGPNGEKWSDTVVKLAVQQTPLRKREWLKKIPDLELVAGDFSNAQVEALLRGEVEAPGQFPPGPEGQKALPPAAETNAGGTWSHPSLAGIPPAPGAKQ